MCLRDPWLVLAKWPSGWCIEAHGDLSPRGRFSEHPSALSPILVASEFRVPSVSPVGGLWWADSGVSPANATVVRAEALETGKQSWFDDRVWRGPDAIATLARGTGATAAGWRAPLSSDGDY